MRRPVGFAEGLSAGAGLVLALGAILLLSRVRHSVAAALARMEEASRAGRNPWTGEPRADYLDLCRQAGL